MKNLRSPLFPFLLVFYEITTYLANDMYLPALPSIAEDLNTTAHSVQLTMTSWFIGTASLQLILGPISDRMGRRPVLLGAGIVFILSSFVCAFTSSVFYLLVARFFQGCVVCSMATAGYASIHEVYEQKEAIRLLALMGSITVLAPALGPFAGALVVQWLNWRWVFIILGSWAFIAIALLWKWMPESHPKEKRHPLQWKTIFRNYKGIVSNKKFLLNTLIFCVMFLGMIVWITAGPFVVIQQFHYSSWVFGLFQAMVFLNLTVASQVIKRIIMKVNVNRLINVGLFIALLGSMLAVTFVFLYPAFLLGLILCLMIYIFGSGLGITPAHRNGIESCTQPMGARMAIFSTIMGVFGVLGSSLVSFTYNGNLLWVATVLFLTASAACVIRWIETRS